jgi:hypothetical protein
MSETAITVIYHEEEKIDRNLKDFTDTESLTNENIRDAL